MLNCGVVKHEESSPIVQDSGRGDDLNGGANEDERGKSVEEKNNLDDYLESPLQSLEAHFLRQQRSYPSRFLEQGLQELGFCCDVDIDDTLEVPSKTIKAATLELSSPRVHNKKPNFDKRPSLSSLDLTEVSGTSCSEQALRDTTQNTIAVNGTSVLSSLSYPAWSLINNSNSQNILGLSNISNYYALESIVPTQPIIEAVKCHSEDHTKPEVREPLKLPIYTPNSISDINESHASPASPTERHQFFKWLSHIVRHSQSSQEKKLHNVICLEDDETLKTMHYFIWMELISWQKGCSPDEMESILNLKRQSIAFVIEAVLNFSIKFEECPQSKVADLQKTLKLKLENQNLNRSSDIVVPELNSTQFDGGYESGHGSLPFFIDDNKSGLPSLKNNDSTCECSDTLSKLCQNCIDQETFALNRVQAIISAVDKVECLYPSLKSLGEHVPAYHNRRFTCRLKTLHAWLNLTEELRQKINLLAKLFGIKDRRKAGWPCYRPEHIEKVGNESPDVAMYGSETKIVARTIPFRNFSVGFSSPSTSGSDKSERSKGSSVPSSPDSHANEPFNLSHSISYNHDPDLPSRNIYRRYVDYNLRHHGLKHMHKHLFTPLRPVLYRVHTALKKPKPEFSPDIPAKFVTEERKAFESALPVKKEYLEELESVGVWSECFQSMGLPTFHKPFFFLLRVFLDVMHECLCLRLEQQPSKPSLLSVGQLIKECKEVLRASTQTRQKYMNLAQTVLGESGNEIIEAQLDAFDDDMKKMLQVYLEYLHHRILIMPNVSQTTRHQKSYLEEEWCFVRAICPNIPGGEALAAKKFCFMSSFLLHSIGIVLMDGIREEMRKFHESDEDKCRDLTFSRKNKALQTYRDIKHTFQDLSERARQVIALAKSLRKDLEIAAEFSLVVSTDQFIRKLKETGHIRVIAPHTSGHVMFVPGNLQHHEMLIWQLVDMTCGHEALDIDGDQAIYLVMMECNKVELSGLIWDGPTIILEPTVEANITLSHVEVNGVLLVVNHSCQLISQCKKFKNYVGNTLKIDRQQTSCNYAIASALNDLKSEALELWDVLVSGVKQVEEELDIFPLSTLDESDQASLLSSYREVLHQGYRFAFEYQKEVMRLITGETKDRFYSSLAKLAEQWMKFVMEKCDEGRGLQTRWANQGLEYLIAVYDSQYGHNLPDENFEVLQKTIHSCIMHLGGAEKSPMVTQALNSPKTGFPHRFQFQSRHWRNRTSLSVSSSDSTLSTSSFSGEEHVKRKRSRDETTSEIDVKAQCDNEGPPMERVRKSVELLEQNQQNRLIKKGVVGQVSTVKIERMPLHVSARRVTFPWQRCFKIGEGRFGKVYTAVNNSTGELIAMKEIHLQPNDHRAIKEALDEIRTFEGIKHPCLVRYYGVEVHREEMLIFMEYCNEGSLESAAQLHLPESLIRKYTRQLLEAVNVLHEHNIVHRDIKSANIFLTSDGELKLGDFGCCIKLKNNTTLPGELCGFVGTPAYMAPEVFTKNVEGGHGRAADVWSIGCVVFEMLTGKRPWHELENSYQIMFTVGMGEVPEIPDSVAEEAHDFLDKCLLINPKERWTTSQLLSHPFTKVPEEEFG